MHKLHVSVGEAFTKISTSMSDLKVELDKACEPANSKNKGKYLPFYLSEEKDRKTKITNVDLMIVEKQRKVKLICEIEESDFTPVRTFGKVFTAAAAIMCKLVDDTEYDLDKKGIFVQVLSSKKANIKGSKKKDQGQKIKDSINDMLKNSGSWIKRYYLIYGDVNDFKPGNSGYLEIEKIVKLL